MTQSEIHQLAKKEIPLKQRIKHTTVTTIIYICCCLMVVVCLLPLWLLFVDATRSTTEINQGMSLIPSGHLVINFNSL